VDGSRRCGVGSTRIRKRSGPGPPAVSSLRLAGGGLAGSSPGSACQRISPAQEFGDEPVRHSSRHRPATAMTTAAPGRVLIRRWSRCGRPGAPRQRAGCQPLVGVQRPLGADSQRTPARSQRNDRPRCRHPLWSNGKRPIHAFGDEFRTRNPPTLQADNCATQPLRKRWNLRKWSSSYGTNAHSIRVAPGHAHSIRVAPATRISIRRGLAPARHSIRGGAWPRRIPSAWRLATRISIRVAPWPRGWSSAGRPIGNRGGATLPSCLAGPA